MRTIKIRLGFLLMALTLFAVACGGGKPSPSEVGKKFLTAVNDLNFEEAKKYATDESASMLDMMAGLMNMGGEDMEKPEPKSITVVGEEIDGDKATVTYTAKDDEGNDVEETIDLVKVDGEWKVKFDKSSMGGGDMDLSMDDMEEEEPAQEEADMMEEMEDVQEETEEVVEEAAEEADQMMDGGMN